MTETLRVGTRRSLLARAQTDWVVRRLGRLHPEIRFKPVLIDASGDRVRSPGVSPDFTDALDQALLQGDLDLAVHSAKDLPAELDSRLDLVACPVRADPRDCLVVARPYRASSLPKGARIGSSSLRRRAQLLRWRPDLHVVEVRGNVDTRIGLVRSGTIEGAILAVAGIARLGRSAEIARRLPVTGFLPAPAQGALAVVTRAGHSSAADLVQRIDDRGTHACVIAERAFAAAIGGDCNLPLGALATCRGDTVSLVGEVLRPDGRLSLRRRRHGPASEARTIGAHLGQAMLDGGARDLISSASQ